MSQILPPRSIGIIVIISLGAAVLGDVVVQYSCRVMPMTTERRGIDR